MGQELEKDAKSRGLNSDGVIHIPGLLARRVRLANGANCYYVTAGEDGPAVILLHGGIEGSSGTAGWRFMATMLGANGFRVYCPDRPGFGLSDVSKPEYLEQGPKAQVDFVTMFADALCIDKFHLSGNSAGCMIAANYVVHNPERVLSVAFIAGGLGDVTEQPRVPGTQSKFSSNPVYVSPGFDGTEAGMKTLMDGIIYEAKAIWPELSKMRVAAATRQRAARPGETAQERQQRFMNDPLAKVTFTTKNRINKLDVPMIYLYGLQDVLIPVENGFNQEDSAENIQFFYPDECGHQGQTDQPDMFNNALMEFFRDGKVSWKTAQWAGVSRRRAINPKFVQEPAGGFPKAVREAYSDPVSLKKALETK